MVFAASATAFAAEPGTVYEWGYQNLCTGGDFEEAKAGALPTYDQNSVVGQDLSATGGWFSNTADAVATVVEGEGFGGGNALKIAGAADKSKWCGAAYWQLPAELKKDNVAIAVSFLYKLSPALEETLVQAHAHITGNSVWAGGEDAAVVKNPGGDRGLAEPVGTPVGDGWYRVTGTAVYAAIGDRTFVRLFVELTDPAGGNMDGDAWILFHDVQVGEAVLTADADAQENRSTTNLIKGGDFEDYGLGEELPATFDDNGWRSNGIDAPAKVNRDEDGNKVIQVAGSSEKQYLFAVAGYEMPALTGGKTYRLSFDYKFIDSTDEVLGAMQAHVSFLNSKQAGTPGGWYTVNLMAHPGETLDNGYTRVTVDFTPTDFEASAISEMRFFVSVNNGGPDTGIYIDNVSLYDLADVDETGDTTTTVEGGSTTTTVEGGATTTTAANTTAEPTDADGTNDPDTGVASAVVPALLLTAASAMAIGASRRRRG